MSRCRLWMFSKFVLSMSSLVLGQAPPPIVTPRPPQLKLEVLPVKQTYFVGETLFVKYKLTSLIDGTLCFPPVTVEAHDAVAGYLTTDATPPTIDEGERFIEVYDGRYPDDEQLRSNVTNRWIKLGMSEPHKPKKAGKVTVLTVPGDWVLRSTYHPPELEARKKSIVEALGCTPPDVDVHSAPVTITVHSALK